VGTAPGRCSCGGSRKLDGKPPGAGPGPAAFSGLSGPGPGVDGPLDTAGVFCRDMWNALIFAMMSGFVAAAPLPAGGTPRAALTLPSGRDEAVMLEMVEADDMSECIRGGDRTGGVGEAMGGDTLSSGEVGGEGESRGSPCSSGEAMLVKSYYPATRARGRSDREA
jgi:hypothetical protein